MSGLVVGAAMKLDIVVIVTFALGDDGESVLGL